MKKTLATTLAGIAVSVIVAARLLALPSQNEQFSISAFPSTARTSAGGSAVKYVAVLNSQGYSGKVLLDCKADSPGVACSVSPSSVQINREIAVSATVTAAATGEATAGSHHLTITATTSDAANQQSTVVSLLVH
jgi:hypothetical protein